MASQNSNFHAVIGETGQRLWKMLPFTEANRHPRFRERAIRDMYQIGILLTLIMGLVFGISYIIRNPGGIFRNDPPAYAQAKTTELPPLYPGAFLTISQQWSDESWPYKRWSFQTNATPAQVLMFYD